MQDVIDLNSRLKRIQSDAFVLFGDPDTGAGGLGVMPIGWQEEIQGDSCVNVDSSSIIIPPRDIDDAEGTTDYSGFNLKYVPNVILPGGVDFNWEQFDLHSNVSFLNALNTTGDSAKTYLSDLKSAATASARLSWPSTFTTNHVLMADGSTLDLTQSFADNAAIASAVETYINDVTAYYELKHTYQTKDLVSYLELEYEVIATGKAYSSNVGIDQSVVLY